MACDVSLRWALYAPTPQGITSSTNLSANLTAEARHGVAAQSGTPFADPCRFDAWPDVPTIVLTGRGDRFFPTALQQAVARQRLAIEPQLVPGSRLASVSHPGPIADRLAALSRSG